MYLENIKQETNEFIDKLTIDVASLIKREVSFFPEKLDGIKIYRNKNEYNDEYYFLSIRFIPLFSEKYILENDLSDNYYMWDSIVEYKKYDDPYYDSRRRSSGVSEFNKYYELKEHLTEEEVNLYSHIADSFLSLSDDIVSLIFGKYDTLTIKKTGWEFSK